MELILNFQFQGNNCQALRQTEQQLQCIQDSKELLCCRLGLGQKLDSAQTQPAQKPKMSDLSIGPAFLPSIANISLYQLVIEQRGKHFVAIYDFEKILKYFFHFENYSREHNSYLKQQLVDYMSSHVFGFFLFDMTFHKAKSLQIVSQQSFLQRREETHLSSV